MYKFNSFVYDLTEMFNPEIVNAKCYVHFRLSPSYIFDGFAGGAPFGFDWIRTGDCLNISVANDIPYKDIVGLNYELNNSTLERNLNSTKLKFQKNAKMYKALISSYLPNTLRMFPVKNNSVNHYHVPVLSIYPKHKKMLGSLDVKDEKAKLLLLIHIEESPKEFFLEYDKDIFDITGADHLPVEVADCKKMEISISCKKEFYRDELIRVISKDKYGRRHLSGMLRVWKNARVFRKSVRIICIDTILRLKQGALEKRGSDMKIARESVEYFLPHALITPIIIKDELVITDDALWGWIKGFNTLHVTNLRVKDYKKATVKDYLHTYLKNRYQKKENNKLLNNKDILIFFMPFSRFYGGDSRVVGVTRENVVILKKEYYNTTAIHEVLHALGLSHSFNNYELGGAVRTKYTYEIYKTDNIMDYSKNMFDSRSNLWEWQWIKIRMNTNKES